MSLGRIKTLILVFLVFCFLVAVATAENINYVTDSGASATCYVYEGSEDYNDGVCSHVTEHGEHYTVYDDGNFPDYPVTFEIEVHFGYTAPVITKAYASYFSSSMDCGEGSARIELEIEGDWVDVVDSAIGSLEELSVSGVWENVTGIKFFINAIDTCDSDSYLDITLDSLEAIGPVSESCPAPTILFNKTSPEVLRDDLICNSSASVVDDYYNVTKNSTIYVGNKISVFHTKTGTSVVTEYTNETVCSTDCFDYCYESCAVIFTQQCVTRCTSHCTNGDCENYETFCGTGGEPFQICTKWWDHDGNAWEKCHTEILGSYTTDCKNKCKTMCQANYNTTTHISKYNQSCGYAHHETITVRYNASSDCAGDIVEGYAFNMSGAGTAVISFNAPPAGAYDICSNLSGLIDSFIVNSSEGGYFTGVPPVITVEDGGSATYTVNFSVISHNQTTFNFSLQRWKDNSHTNETMEIPSWLHLTRGGQSFNHSLIPVNGSVLFNISIDHAEIFNWTTYYNNIIIFARSPYFNASIPFNIHLTPYSLNVTGNITFKMVKFKAIINYTSHPINSTFKDLKLSGEALDLLKNVKIIDSNGSSRKYDVLEYVPGKYRPKKIGVSSLTGTFRVIGNVDTSTVNISNVSITSSEMRVSIKNLEHRFYADKFIFTNVSLASIKSVTYTPEGWSSFTIPPANYTFYPNKTLVINAKIPINYATGSNYFTFVGANANLSIWDQYEGSSVQAGNSIEFYANYTNLSDGSHISGATCKIRFDDNWNVYYNMTDNGHYYNFTKSNGYSSQGTHYWNVTCSKSGYDTLAVQDDIDIAASSVPEFNSIIFVILAFALIMFIAKKAQA